MAKAVFVSLYNKEAIGLSYLSSYLKSRGHEAVIIFLKKYCQVLKKNIETEGDNYHTMVDSFGRDLILAYNSPFSERELRLFVDLIKELRPDFIGFSLTTVVFNAAVKLTALVKKEIPGIPVIWGGIEPTIEPEKCLEFADIVCLGEGEEAVCEFAEAISEDKDYRGIRNLWFKDEDRLIKNDLRELIQDLDSIPLPDFSFDDKYLIDSDRLFQGKMLQRKLNDGHYETITSRGCPFSCTYCCNDQLKILYPNQKYIRRRSVENVIDELRLVKRERKPDFIDFHDDIFTFNRQWIEKFADLYKQYINLPFFCNIHPRYTKEDIILTLKNSGLSGTTFGIQSGSEYVANEIYNRKVLNEDIIACSNLLHRLGINHNFDLITNNPLETEEHCIETLDLLLALPRPRLNNGLSKLSFFPGTEITKMLDDRGIKKGADENLYSFYNKLYLITQLRLPRRFVKSLSKIAFLKRRPELLNGFFVLTKLRHQTRGVAKKIVPKKVRLQIKKYL